MIKKGGFKIKEVNNSPSLPTAPPTPLLFLNASTSVLYPAATKQ